MVIFSEAHLRRILSAYATYYNQARTHLALQKDAPLHRTVQRSGAIVAIPILAGITNTSGYDFRKGQLLASEFFGYFAQFKFLHLAAGGAWQVF
jgi:hypothetical protein